MFGLFASSLVTDLALALLVLVVIDSNAFVSSMYLDHHHPQAKLNDNRLLSRRAT
jgi:hypothetical protein